MGLDEMRAGGDPSPRDRRAHQRFAVDEQAGLLIVGHGLSLKGRILDMSLEGCRIQTSAHLPGGGCVRVEVTFTINGLPFRMGGLVQRSQAGEVGVRFAGASTHRQAEWAEVVEEVKELACHGYEPGHGAAGPGPQKVRKFG